MSVSQSAFREGVFDSNRPAPDGLIDPEGRPAGKRFDVYRNNVAVSLTEAMEVAFPVIRKLVGDAFFKAMAGVFLRIHPPRSPMLMLYGDAFPGFLEGFGPVGHLGYLADVARLELAIRESYHAADATPVAPEALQQVAPDALMHLRLGLAPALRVVRSRWPVHAIWLANTRDDAPAPGGEAQDVVVTRPAFDPLAAPLGPGGAEFIAALNAGETLGAALGLAGAARPGFDLAATLGQLIGGGAITSIKDPTT